MRLVCLFIAAPKGYPPALTLTNSPARTFINPEMVVQLNQPFDNPHQLATTIVQMVGRQEEVVGAIGDVAAVMADQTGHLSIALDGQLQHDAYSRLTINKVRAQHGLPSLGASVSSDTPSLADPIEPAGHDQPHTDDDVPF